MSSSRTHLNPSCSLSGHSPKTTPSFIAKTTLLRNCWMLSGHHHTFFLPFFRLERDLYFDYLTAPPLDYLRHPLCVLVLDFYWKNWNWLYCGIKKQCKHPSVCSLWHWCCCPTLCGNLSGVLCESNYTQFWKGNFGNIKKRVFKFCTNLPSYHSILQYRTVHTK